MSDARPLKPDPRVHTPVTRVLCNRLLIIWHIVSLCVCAIVFADDEPISLDRVLAPQRWYSQGWGVALRPPIGARMFQRTADDLILPDGVDSPFGGADAVKELGNRLNVATLQRELLQRDVHDDDIARRLAGIDWLGPDDVARLLKRPARLAIVRMAGTDGWFIDFSCHSLPSEHDASKFPSNKTLEMATSHPQAAVIAESQFKVADRDCRIVYVHVPQADNRPWVVGMAFVKIDPLTVAMLKLTTLRHRMELDRPLFEAVASSLVFDKPEVIDSKRSAQVDNAKNWRKLLGVDKLHIPTFEERWLRIVTSQGDVGYMRVRMTLGHDPVGGADEQGLRVIMRSRLLAGEQVLDTEQYCYVSNDSHRETWTIKTTARPREGAAKGTALFNWVETGVRDGLNLKVSRVDPSGDHSFVARLPALDTYLSQAELFTVPASLPRTGDHQFGFYAWYQGTQSLSYHTFRVEPTKQGHWLIYAQRAPDYLAHIVPFDGQGSYMGTYLPSGRALVPTTQEELKRLWKFEDG